VGHQTLMLVAICAGGYAGISALGCAGSPTQAGGGDNFDTTPSGTPASADTYVPKHESSSGKDDPLTEDQKAQMEIALRRGGVKASNCASVVPDAARGEGEVKVTFDGKKGRATDAVVGPPWAGTDAESCIKRAFVGEFVVPFDGSLEVPYTVKLPPKADADPKGKKK
jgi:hypothetical protein